MKTSIDQNLNIAVPSAIGAKVSFQRGLSLIELMISITLGLIILAALSTLFINQTRTRVELDKSNRMIDNGRYAMEIISNDMRLSGYLGEYVPAPSACSNAPVGIGGYNVGTSDTFSPSPDADIPVASLRKGSDILIVRRASTETPIVQGAAVDGVQYLQVSLCQFDALSYKISTNPADFTLRKKTCKSTDTLPYAAANLADLRRLLEHVYFISPDNEAGDGIPTLKRLETNKTTGVREIVPLVEGIEYMQIEYGVDNNASFQMSATTTAGSLVLTELSDDPVATRIKPGMGVYDSSTTNKKIPAGYTVDPGIPFTPVTIPLLKAAGAGPIVSGTAVPLTIPYLTATITPNSPVLTNLSAEPKWALVREGNEICGAGIPAGTTIADFTEPPTAPITITLSKNAIQCDPDVPLSSCPLVPLNIPAIAISPAPIAGDGVADVYKSAPLDTDWANVVSVKITLLARNTEATKGYTDTKTYDLGNGQTIGPFNAAPYNASPYPTTYPKMENYKRHVYTQFIRLVNTAGRRE